MTKAEWLAQVIENKEALTEFISNFYPTKRVFDPEVNITAGAAQAACDVVCASIATKDSGVDPVLRFNMAIADGDISVIMNLLNSAWFGTPETTSCWQYTGFREAVGLLEDPPEDEGF